MQTLKVFGLVALSLLAAAADVPAQPVGPAAPPLTLDEAIVLARAESPRLAAADALTGAAIDAERYAGAVVNPSFDVSTENWGATDAVPLDVFAIVTQPFELGGKRRVRRTAAAAEATVARSFRDDTAQQLVRATGPATSVPSARATSSTSSVEQRADADELVGIMQRRVDEGTAAEAELRKLETEVARVDTLIVRARIEARAAEYRLRGSRRRTTGRPRGEARGSGTAGAAGCRHHRRGRRPTRRRAGRARTG